MSKKVEEGSFYSAELELTAIYHAHVKYRVVKPKGANVLAFSHVQMDRKVGDVDVFPRDDDFSLDFLNSKIPNYGNQVKALKAGEKEGTALTKRQREFITMAEGNDKLREKQAKFRHFQKAVINIELNG